jgi:XRE family transcriptional regulator, regulator of sulfur utilization
MDGADDSIPRHEEARRFYPLRLVSQGAGMTRRDAVVALFSVVLTLAAVAVTSARADVLPSTLFEWSTLTAQPNAKGEVRRVVQKPTATLEELEIHITTLKPGEESHPPHQHVNEEILIVKEGQVEALVNGELKRGGPGSLIFQASNQLHNIKNVGTTPATYHVINWKTANRLSRVAVDSDRRRPKHRGGEKIH